MYQVPCPPEVAKIPCGYDSDSDDDSLAYWWDSSEDIRMTNPGGNATTVVNTADLSDIITQRTRNNYGQVQGLRYFCAGRRTPPEFPNHVFETSARNWIADIESHTTENWTDAGRTQLAKQYAKGPAQRLLINAELIKDNPNLGRNQETFLFSIPRREESH